ncbi:PepSY-like domain-containing protein [Hyunsoonleella sp. 2307UL5-6]|uniref:PepSY-like domain-containing protein n=1 Tax=Hyunsoonleella sp. 2307UL5-6 TaxID=3384768 RepID=UPI0039BCF8CA
MKKPLTSIILFCIVLTFSCNTSVNSQAPEAVKTTFKAKYPGENDPDWHKDSHGNYESHFKIDGIKYRADFKADGTWIETESSINMDDLPKAIKEKIEKDFDGKISEIEKVDHHSKGLFYDVEFKQKGKNKDIEFKADGTIIN